MCFFFGKPKKRTSLKAVSAIECVWMGYFFEKWLVYNMGFMLSHSSHASCMFVYVCMHFIAFFSPSLTPLLTHILFWSISIRFILVCSFFIAWHHRIILIFRMNVCVCQCLNVPTTEMNAFRLWHEQVQTESPIFWCYFVWTEFWSIIWWISFEWKILKGQAIVRLFRSGRQMRWIVIETTAHNLTRVNTFKCTHQSKKM